MYKKKLALPQTNTLELDPQLFQVNQNAEFGPFFIAFKITILLALGDSEDITLDDLIQDLPGYHSFLRSQKEKKHCDQSLNASFSDAEIHGFVQELSNMLPSHLALPNDIAYSEKIYNLALYAKTHSDYLKSFVRNSQFLTYLEPTCRPDLQDFVPKIISKRIGKYPFIFELDHDLVSIEIQCDFPIEFDRDRFLRLENTGFEYLQRIKLIPSDSEIEKLRDVRPDYFDQIQRIKDTNITLLSMLTLSNTVSDKGINLNAYGAAWLFVFDNLADKKQSPLHDRTIMTAVFDKFRKALQGEMVDPISPDLLLGKRSFQNVAKQTEWVNDLNSLIDGIRLIGTELNALCPSDVVGDFIKYGFEPYQLGNACEALTRSDQAIKDAGGETHERKPKGLSTQGVAWSRDNAGAVDFMIELALVAEGIKVPSQIRVDPLYQFLRSCARTHICHINDIVSADKEIKEGHRENMVLAVLGTLTKEAALNFVVDDANKIPEEFSLYLCTFLGQYKGTENEAVATAATDVIT